MKANKYLKIRTYQAIAHGYLESENFDTEEKSVYIKAPTALEAAKIFDSMYSIDKYTAEERLIYEPEEIIFSPSYYNTPDKMKSQGWIYIRRFQKNKYGYSTGAIAVREVIY